LQAKVSGQPVPKITWFKDGVPVNQNFGYVSGFDPENGVCSLIIEEALVEDSANWSLRASNAAGNVPAFFEVVFYEKKI
jgi:hypothetical protein